MSLVNHVALVTGAQQGIGRAAAIALAEAGADVAVNWLDDEAAAQDVADAVHKAGRLAMLVHADVGDIAAGAKMVEQVAAHFGRLDILVNNAGIYPRAPFLELTEALWDSVHGVNLKGSAFVGQAAAKVMIAGGVGGAIINMSSQSIRGAVLGAHYSASKAGLLGLTRSMALELAPHGIRVNAIAPGVVDTAQPRGGFSEEGLAALATTLPLGRLGLASDIANAVVFLASDRSAFMTGEVMQINGGGYMA
jgi:NAD(P)-dependent dehydrogenase (short-subunit alcohol dehydrogenase family)